MIHIIQNKRGYMLLEIVVALAILGVLLASVFQMTYRSGQSIRNQEIRARSLLTAHSLSAWWFRLPDINQEDSIDKPFQAMPADCGLRNISEYQWQIRRENVGQNSYFALTVRHSSGYETTVNLPTIEAL